MMFHWAVLFLPAAISQFLPLQLSPDMAFGEQNDRFDLSSMYKPHHKHKMRSHDRRIMSRRSNVSPVDSHHSNHLNSRRAPDDDWLEDLTSLAEDKHADGALNKNQDNIFTFGRHQPFKIYKVSENDPTYHVNTGTLPKEALPVNIELKDRAVGSFVFNFYKTVPLPDSFFKSRK
ncbi:hypothetical protein O0L34_g17733 [Tuta absoluta]|nr:hypothetical protein O0L34_g17733 [Tuta absoluta]